MKDKALCDNKEVAVEISDEFGDLDHLALLILFVRKSNKFTLKLKIDIKHV